jgi:uncharacterized UPF0160 family protein
MIVNGKEYERSIQQIKNRNSVATEISRIVVHAGRFHADDVFCAAMLLMIYPNAEVLRVVSVSEDLSNDDKAIVADIGYGKYDHHQPDAEIRSDGNRYSACGLVFRDFKHILFDGNLAAAERFERKYILPVEIDDNGGAGNPLSSTISAFNPSWDSGEDSDAKFAEAVSFVQSLIERELQKMDAEARAEVIVKKALAESDGRIVLLHQDLPWRDFLIKTTAIYAVYPSIRGGYNIQTVPEKEGSKKPKKPLPKEWINNRPDGCNFVHPDLFIASFDTEAAAMATAKQAASL